MSNDNYNDIGALLRTARQETQLSLLEAADRLHIRARYLEALEQGRFDDLPGEAYIKGYLLAYAGFLDLDKDEVERRFEQMQAQLPRRGLYLPDALSKEKKPTSGAIWGGAGLAVAVYLLWLVAFKPSVPSAPEVEPLPEKPVVHVVYYHSLPLDGACFRRVKAVYPPCFNDAQAEAFALLPLPHKIVSLDLN